MLVQGYERCGDHDLMLIPRSVIERALFKARIEYERGAERAGHNEPAPGECWAEFERLADHLID